MANKQKIEYAVGNKQRMSTKTAIEFVTFFLFILFMLPFAIVVLNSMRSNAEIINSPIGKDSAHDDSYLRKAAIKNKIPYITTMAAAKAAVEGVALAQKMGNGEVRSLQEWHAEIR